jgi:alanine dehydrogenase
MPFILDLANKGTRQALSEDRHLRNGLNIHRGLVTVEAVAQALGYNHVEPMSALREGDLKATA